jgi:glycosyltransferase involved in cell wall biosynthesis
VQSSVKRARRPERALLRSCRRIANVLWRQGCLAVARRKAMRAGQALSEQLRVLRLGRRPWLRDGRAVFLLITHRCGGGTERHVRELARSLLAEGLRVVIVRPSSRGRVLWEEQKPSQRIGWCHESSGDRDSTARLLSLLAPVHAHIHHALGLPDALIELVQEAAFSYDWSIHDYHTICPRTNLVGSSGAYCGEPDATECERCLARLGDDQGRPVTLGIVPWRARFSRHLSVARRVFAPSEDAARRVSAHFPGASVVVRPHAEQFHAARACAEPYRPHQTVHVAVLGTITAVKGSEKLLACAADAQARCLDLAFTVLGTTDCDAELRRMGIVRVTGPYRDDEVFDHLRKIRCNLAFMPSVWPETFMYTLSIAMAARMYVVCFDLGAQSARLKKWGWGRTLPLDTSPGAINDALIAAAHWLSVAPAAPAPPEPAAYSDLLGGYYGFGDREQARMGLGGRTAAERLAQGARSLREFPQTSRRTK